MLETTFNDQELMHIHCKNEYVIDAGGKILTTNHWSVGAPASFLFVRSNTSNHWHFGHDIDSRISVPLVENFRLEPLGFTADLVGHNLYTDIFNLEFVEKDIFDSWVFCQKMNTNPSSEDEIGVVQIFEANSKLLERYFSAMLGFKSQVLIFDQPIFAKIVDGHAVSVCNSARNSSQGAECYIATTERYRGMGYGKQVTALWAKSIYDSKKLPFLNTTIDNYSAIKIAEKTGFELIGRVLRVA